VSLGEHGAALDFHERHGQIDQRRVAMVSLVEVLRIYKNDLTSPLLRILALEGGVVRWLVSWGMLGDDSWKV